MGRKLLFFFDGSSNTIIGPKNVVPTNIYYLNQAFSSGSPESPQISFYFSGVGTHGDPLSAATGKGFDEIVINAYTNLASNYQPGDSIYLFGFSRGAAAARVLSALISWPGLLKDTELVRHFENIWKLYVEYPPGTRPNDDDYAIKRRVLLNNLTSMGQSALWTPTPKVQFLGAFDTVPGCSWDKEKMFVKLRIRNLRLERCVQKAVHLLSADDNRIPSFEPLLWNAKSSTEQHVEQIWMPGVHGDVGGCSNGVFIGYIALLTMLARVAELCPELDIEPWFCKFIKEKTFNREDHGGLHVSNERPTLKMLALWWGKRRPGKPNERPGEMAHELLREMHGASINVRGKTKLYRVHESWLALPHYTSPFSDELKQFVRQHHR